VTNLISPPPRIIPQFEQDVFSSVIDCEACKLTGGMLLRSAWHSTIDTGQMNLCFECTFCHKRKWARVALPEPK
jgi:hypothetical protein